MSDDRATATRARTYHRAQLVLSLLGLALTAVYLVALIVTGTAGALASAVATLTSSWWQQLAICLLTLGVAYRIVALPLSWLGGYWLPRRFDLLHQPFHRWLLDSVKATLIGGVLGLVAAEIVYALLRNTPWWWLWSALALLAVSALTTLVAPVWLAPLFYTLTPLPDGDLKDRLVRLAERVGAPVLGVWIGDQSRKSRTANAAVTGLGRTRRIILFDTLIGAFTPDEIESVLAHELAHHVHGDVWRGLAVQSAITLGTLWLADVVLRAAGPALGLSGPADPAGLPLLGLTLMAAGVIALPLGNGWSRHVERAADDFSLRVTGNPGAFISAMERLAGLNLAERDPHPVKEILMYSHPSIGRRVARAQAFSGSASA